MIKKVFEALVLFAVLINISLSADNDHIATPLKNQLKLEVPLERTACTLSKTSGVFASYFANYQVGMGTYTYFDPANCGATPTYPFEITSFAFSLYDNGGAYSWPVDLDIVIYDIEYTGDTCAGPGTDYEFGGLLEICRYSLTVDQITYGYPNLGTFTFPTPCCVDRPFFIGIEYASGTLGLTPSIMFDDYTGTTGCDNWILNEYGSMQGWDNFWIDPDPGYPLFWVYGETASLNCDYGCDAWHENYPSKMHYPQLPSETGWDVLAYEMADDFMCNETGYIKNVHFWVSWKNGNEALHDLSGISLQFYTDIPADQSPTGFSIPGEPIGAPIGIDPRFTSDLKITPMISGSLQGWYWPGVETFPDNHLTYYQFDYCLKEFEWITQESGTIYWLSITFDLLPRPDGHLGWKTSDNHWNDNAVFRLGWSQDWLELYDPVTGTDPLDFAFVITGDPEFSTTTGACCISDGTCSQISYQECVGAGGTYTADGILCLGDSDGDGKDDLCVPPGPGACCLPDLSCSEMNVDLCGLLGGTHLGPGTVCLGDNNSNGIDDACESETCDCIPGEADGNPPINILDIVYIINYKYKGGAAPIPYAVCNGDTDCNCTVNILDIVLLINYKYKDGPPPCDCDTWATNCGALVK